FQAEDGIRVSSVTGVQTCALPISRRHVELHRGHHCLPRDIARAFDARGTLHARIGTISRGTCRGSASRAAVVSFATGDDITVPRSEERRVGKESKKREVKGDDWLE